MTKHPTKRSWSLVRSLFLASLFASAPAYANVDWAQPPVQCAEETVPALPQRPCLDLSQVNDPMKDWPAMAPEDIQYWQANKRPLGYCRALEILRREALQPGSQAPGRVETSWMQKISVENRTEKINAVYQASREHSMPAQILAGALYQESLFSELGIAEDGFNYSCGVGQVNLAEWCSWANTQSVAKKAELGWPVAGANCSQLDPKLIKPFYDIAKTRLQGLPEYRLEKSHFSGISLNDVIGAFPPATQEVQALRFQSANSFIQNCSRVGDGIAAKANALALLYRNYIPTGMKLKDTYQVGERYQRQCQQQAYDGQYPLHIGWLLAVGSYNAGPRAVDAVAHYNEWTSDDLKRVETFDQTTPRELIESIYWTGQYSPSDDKIHFRRLDGVATNWIWYKACVLQRHIARVVQHVTLTGTPPLVDTLEGAYKCAKSVFDPTTGALIKSSVPPFRQTSTGVKAP